MDYRERVLRSLPHEKPDQVLQCLGFTDPARLQFGALCGMMDLDSCFGNRPDVPLDNLEAFLAAVREE